MILPMFLTITIGILAGIVLATPPGVINLTILHYVSQGKPRNAFWIGAGSATLDIFYGALAMYSASAVYRLLQGFIDSNPILMKLLEAGLLIALIGFASYKLFVEPRRNLVKKPVATPIKSRNLHPYFLGCALALTHIVVPTFLPGYAYLAAILINSGIIPATNLHYWTIAVAFGFGNLLWVVGIVGYFRNADPILEKNRFRRIDVTIGILFLAIGLFGASRLFY